VREEAKRVKNYTQLCRKVIEHDEFLLANKKWKILFGKFKVPTQYFFMFMFEMYGDYRHAMIIIQ
jgi:hypothetical protein